MKKCILLVEDDPANRLVATFFLAEAGYDCDVAENGREAIELAQRSPDKYCAVLMDLRLPELCGLDVARAIRRHEEEKGLPRLPIIALTASARNSDKENCFAAGMDGFLAKPYEPWALMDLLHLTCRNHSPESPDECTLDIPKARSHS